MADFKQSKKHLLLYFKDFLKKQSLSRVHTLPLSPPTHITIQTACRYFHAKIRVILLMRVRERARLIFKPWYFKFFFSVKDKVGERKKVEWLEISGIKRHNTSYKGACGEFMYTKDDFWFFFFKMWNRTTHICHFFKHFVAITCSLKRIPSMYIRS